MGLVGRRDAGGKKQFILENWQDMLLYSTVGENNYVHRFAMPPHWMTVATVVLNMPWQGIEQRLIKLTYAPDDASDSSVREEYQLGFLPIFFYRVDF